METESLEYYYKDKLEKVKYGKFAFVCGATQIKLKEILDIWLLEDNDGETTIKVKVTYDDNCIKIKKVNTKETQKDEIVYENKSLEDQNSFFKHNINNKILSKIDIEMKEEDEIKITIYDDLICDQLSLINKVDAILVFNTQTSNGNRYNCLLIPKVYLFIIFN